MDDAIKIIAFYFAFVFIIIFGIIGIFLIPNGVLLFMVILALIFGVMGLAIVFGKGNWLIAGYNTMTLSEKESFGRLYDMGRLRKGVGISMIVFAVGFACMAWDSDISIWLFGACMIIGTVLIVWFTFGSSFAKND